MSETMLLGVYVNIHKNQKQICWIINVSWIHLGPLAALLYRLNGMAAGWPRGARAEPEWVV